jgi:hypothetical protein
MANQRENICEELMAADIFEIGGNRINQLEKGIKLAKLVLINHQKWAGDEDGLSQSYGLWKQ